MAFHTYTFNRSFLPERPKKLRLALFYVNFVHPLFSSVKKEINPHCN